MPLIPAKLPPFAFVAVGAGAFILARVARSAASSSAPADTSPEADANATAPAPVAGNPTADLWGGDSDSGFVSQFPQGGVLPQVDRLADLLGGQPLPYTIPGTPAPAPAPLPGPTPQPILCGPKPATVTPMGYSYVCDTTTGTWKLVGSTVATFPAPTSTFSSTTPTIGTR